MTDNKPKKLFKVASEFNVSTKSIVDTLADQGFELPNKPNSKVTSDMYQALEDVYGQDKAKSQEHEKVREEYESRRSDIKANRNETVSIDSFLEPIDDLDPIDEPVEKPAEVEPPAPEEEPVPEPVEEPPAVEETEVPSEEPEEEEETTDPEEVETPVAEQEDETEEPEPVAEESIDSDEDIQEEEDEDEDEGEEEPDEDEPEEDVDDDESESDEESIIRGRAGKLKGTKVIGKVSVTKSSKKKMKKRKRKKDRTPEEEAAAAEKPRKESSSDKGKKKSSRKKGKKSKIDEEDVEKKMKETMQQMKSSGTVGSKRQKRRRQRREEREEERQLQEELEGLEDEVLEVTEFITVSDLAELLDVKPNDVITTCMSIGMMVSINQRLDASTIELVAEEFDRDVEFVDAEEMIDEIEEEAEDDPEDLETRAPIITVMGHVDHGKTSLLDYIRKTKVAAGEAGGITQHVGAYAVTTDDGRKITFLDTPGHEAFTAMRSRGAQATDIVILVVAADDSVMPQTIEAINHAKAAGVSIVIAINKIDKPEANPERIKQQLSEHEVMVEEWGGENQSAEVSAMTGQGIEELLEKVLIEAELMELKANPDRRASGVVLESRVDKGKGIIANILVQNGTLRIGDPFVAGPCFGRVRAMENEHGKRLTEAGPSTPIQLMGFDDIPQSGDRMIVPADEKTAKEIANQRQKLKREQSLRKAKHLTLDDLSRRLALGEVSELNIIIKADVDGSIEALSGALQKLSTDEVAVNIIHTGSGAITESDVLLASASEGIIIGFQVRPTANARKLAEAESIDVRLFSVIYDAVDEVRDALEGLLSPELKEQMIGVAQVRDTFKVSKIGTIAGCYVTDGKINRNLPVRVIRDGVVIYDGKIDSLKRFKEDVKDVQSGYECGISIVGYNDIKVGDEIECYEITEEKRKLEDSPG